MPEENPNLTAVMVELAALKSQVAGMHQLMNERASYADGRNTRIEKSIEGVKQEVAEMRSEIADELSSNKKAMQDELKTLETKVDMLSTLATKWRGAVLVLIGLGGVVAWATDLWKKVRP